jgi:hypothetical protein
LSGGALAAVETAVGAALDPVDWTLYIWMGRGRRRKAFCWLEGTNALIDTKLCIFRMIIMTMDIEKACKWNDITEYVLARKHF